MTLLKLFYITNFSLCFDPLFLAATAAQEAHLSLRPFIFPYPSCVFIYILMFRALLLEMLLAMLLAVLLVLALAMLLAVACNRDQRESRKNLNLNNFSLISSNLGLDNHENYSLGQVSISTIFKSESRADLDLDNFGNMSLVSISMLTIF